MVVATCAASLRRMADSSPVETTTTDFSNAAPSVSSRNSFTSRPRSPMSAMTALSKPADFAIIERRVDFPTPEPAKTPMRWP
jgi:hypothetical protein